MMHARPICLFTFLFFHAVSAHAQLDFKTVETDNLRLIYYDEQHEYIIPHLTRCFENSLAFHRRLFDYTPSEKVTIILRDLNDHGYAGATSLPINYLIIGIEPFEQVYETSPTNERLNWVMSHELLHVLASDQAASSDRFFRKLFFGKVMTNPEAPISMLYSYLTSPRMYAPRWYHEGMAVFMETWMAGGYGRVLGGYDEMVFRTMVNDDDYFYDVVGLESEGTTTDFQVGQMSYLYGTRFISYLAYHYGPDAVLQWLNRKDGSKRNFSAQFKHVYGTGLDDEWARWIEWERGWQRSNLDSIRMYTQTPYRVLSRRPLGSVSRGYYDPLARKLYTAVLYPGEVAHVVEIDVDTWRERKIVEVPTPALYFVSSLAYDDSSGSMFYTTDNSHQWRDLNVVNVHSRKSRRLLPDIRTGDLVFNKADRSLWGIRHHNGISTLVRIPPPYEDGYGILPLPYGRDLFDIDISPDGRYLSGSLIEITGRQRLILMRIEDLLVGESIFETLYEFTDYSPANFVFSRDGRYLFGTSYYTGVSNVFRYDLENRAMEILTNGDTGYFRPVPVSDDSLIVFRYSAKGFLPIMMAIEPIDALDPVQAPDAETAALVAQAEPESVTVHAIRFLGQQVVESHPLVLGWMLPPPSAVEIDSSALVPREYRAIRNIGLSSAYPITESYKDRAAWGLRFELMDPMWLHGIEISASYSPSASLPENERFHGRLAYSHWPWELTATINRADFYDYFGPTKFSRKGYSVGLKYEGVLINERPRHLDYTASIAAYGDLEKLPDYQNINASFDKSLTASAGLKFRSFRKTIGGVESEKGIAWSLNGANHYVNGEFFPRYWANLDYGLLLPWDHSSIWLRTAAGAAHGDGRNSFANFFFGGFGNNWVDHGIIKRYREYYSFPGVEINEVGGQNFAKLVLEWTLPPKRFKRFGVPKLYSNWAHLTFFTSGIATDIDERAARRELLSAGTQLDFKLVIFSTMSSTFSVGYAMAFEEGTEPSDEFMISLRILQ